ncbi:MAG: hypothetical protein JW715_03850 [Sedimentisphaerales bacterium]|nr:hypothetical protein [Sedimentisphaerales bacterium]
MTSGYLIVKTFQRMYRKYLELRDKMKYPLPDDKVIYSIPWKEKLSQEYYKQYRGVSRYTLFSWDETDEKYFRGSGMVEEPKDNELEAHFAIGRLEKLNKIYDDLIETYEDAIQIFNLLKAPIEREIIWIREVDSYSKEVPDYILLGYEPAWFGGDWFSAISDCMCFPLWHGTDTEGELFKEYHAKLNQNALFDTPEIAEEFLKYYLSFDWTEHVGDYTIIAIRLVRCAG